VVLGLRPADINVADRQVLVVDGKGGHQRWRPVANRFFTSVGSYLHEERPVTGTDRVLVVVKGA
jgi:integrase/recombinase XerD